MNAKGNPAKEKPTNGIVFHVDGAFMRCGSALIPVRIVGLDGEYVGSGFNSERESGGRVLGTGQGQAADNGRDRPGL